MPPTKSLPPEVVAQVLEALGIDSGTMSEMEVAMERLKGLIGHAGLSKLLAELPAEDNSPKPCPKCGRAVRVRNVGVARTVETLSGSQEVLRNYHYCDHCKSGFYPRDAELGLPSEGAITLELEKRVLDFAVTADSYESGARRWRMHYPRSFSATLFRAVAERVGKRREQCDPDIAQRAQSPGRVKPAQRLYAMADGGMVPMVGGGWREVKLGVVFRAEDHVTRTKLRRGYLERARYVGVLGDQESFKLEMKACLDVEDWSLADEVVYLGDGARGIWTIAETVAPNATQILDVQHAIENGVDCGKALLGEGSPLLELWHKRVEQLIYRGDVNAVVQELMDVLLEVDNPFATKAIGALVGYYRNNEHRMRYDEFLARGLLIGSGVIESAHRHVIQTRMKKAGQHWGEQSGARMVQLRTAYATAGEDQFHTAINRALLATHLRRVKQRQKKAA